jgi:DNA-binding XRE family transcriptional regulator
MSQGLRVSVKTARVFIRIEGVIPGEILSILQAEYGRKLIVRSMVEMEQMRDVLMAPLYEVDPREMSPGDYLRRFRLDKRLTQAELGRRLGGIPRQNVSNMETGRRPISRIMAIRLARLFGVSAERFNWLAGKA